MQATLRHFADQGWLVLRPSYPLATDDYPTWQSAPQAVADACAWICEHAAELGGDPDRTVLLGDSVGGGLALNLANDLTSGTAAGPRPSTLVALYPTVDIEAVEGVTLFNAGGAARRYTGATPDSVPERYAAVSASRNLTPGLPPCLIIQGTADSFVPPKSVPDYADASRELGNEVSLMHVPLVNHAFDSQAAGLLGFQLSTTVAGQFLAGVLTNP